MQITEKDRIAARLEREQSKRKMSVKAVEKIRDLAQEKKRDAEAEQQFAAQFERLEKDSWALRQLLERMSRPAKESNMTEQEIDSLYDRRTLKLRRCLAKGWRPESVRDVVFFAELTPAESNLSSERFYDLMSKDWPTLEVAEFTSACQPNGGGKPTPEYRKTKVCPRCSKRFPFQRSSAVYCSERCRQRALRQKPETSTDVTLRPSGGLVAQQLTDTCS